MNSVVYVAFAIVHIAIVVGFIRLARQQQSWVLWVLAVVGLGIAYDNAIVGLGSTLGAGDTLMSLNIVRYVLHAVATPLMMIGGITLARNARVAWAWRRGMTIFTYVTMLACIAYGLNEYLVNATFEVAKTEPLRYVLAGGPHGPPLSPITTMTFLIAFGIALYIQDRSWWLLAGALTMFATAAMQMGIIENLGEVVLMLSFYLTAKQFAPLAAAQYQADLDAMSSQARSALADEQRARKRKTAVWNRWIAWIIFVSLAIDTCAVYANDFFHFDKWVHLTFSNIYIMLFFVHAVASLYFFGIPKLRAHTRTVHVYIGYGVFIFTMVSQSIIGMEPLHIITYVINWVFIVAHIVLSIRFMLQRVRHSTVDPLLEMTVSPHLQNR